jgi:rhodanese-related sulfurtransferase
MDLTQTQWAGELAQDPDAVILDVRTPEEWEEGIIPGATMIDIYSGQEFMAAIQALDKEKHYYVYCKSGGRSRQACDIMDTLGIGKTYNLVGGFSQWTGEKAFP